MWEHPPLLSRHSLVPVPSGGRGAKAETGHTQLVGTPAPSPHPYNDCYNDGGGGQETAMSPCPPTPSFERQEGTRRTFRRVNDMGREGQILQDSLLGHPQWSQNQRQEVDGRLAWVGEGMGSRALPGAEGQCGKMRKFWRRLVGMADDFVSLLNVTELDA